MYSMCVGNFDVSYIMMDTLSGILAHMHFWFFLIWFVMFWYVLCMHVNFWSLTSSRFRFEMVIATV